MTNTIARWCAISVRMNGRFAFPTLTWKRSTVRTISGTAEKARPAHKPSSTTSTPIWSAGSSGNKPKPSRRLPPHPITSRPAKNPPVISA